jgi:hypothetical protein
LTGGEGGISQTARLNELFIKYETKVFRKAKKGLEKTHKFLIETEQLAENKEWFLEIENVYYVNRLVHSNYNYFKSQKIWWRRHFKGLMILGLLVLAVVTYYPLIGEFIRLVL